MDIPKWTKRSNQLNISHNNLLSDLETWSGTKSNQKRTRKTGIIGTQQQNRFLFNIFNLRHHIRINTLPYNLESKSTDPSEKAPLKLLELPYEPSWQDDCSKHYRTVAWQWATSLYKDITDLQAASSINLENVENSFWKIIWRRSTIKVDCKRYLIPLSAHAQYDIIYQIIKIFRRICKLFYHLSSAHSAASDLML